MPEGPDGKTIIIVKKVSGHGGHHGGAWKVAYADFVTAMMALFLVLWLVNSASVVTKEAIASYFKRPGVFEKGSGTPLEIGGAGILPDTFAPAADAISQIMAHKRIYDSETLGERGLEGIGGEQQKEEEIEFEKIATELKESLEGQSGEIETLLGQIDIKVDQRGLVIEIMDTPTASMFQVGSARILPEANEALLSIATILKQLPNPIDIEGHTDARPFSSSQSRRYDNWDLATDRANAARRMLRDAGIQEWQIARVVGYADQRLKRPDEPFNPSNRRISISMRFTEQASQALKGTQAVETSNKPLKQLVQPEKPKVDEKTKIKVRPKDEKDLFKGRRGEQEEESRTNVLVQPFIAVDPSNEPPPEPEPMPEPETGTRSKVGGLEVEIRTELPEGAEIDNADTEPSRPLHIEKDKIFGDGNGFFSK
ncbi:MAG: OmpA family protein [Bdellovibrionales bacterium]|nr:OmpA family protein [Bdellovibrionales bacterium]